MLILTLIWQWIMHLWLWITIHAAVLTFFLQIVTALFVWGQLRHFKQKRKQYIQNKIEPLLRDAMSYTLAYPKGKDYPIIPDEHRFQKILQQIHDILQKEL